MTARVLVVDDILSNVKLLEAKLTSEYFEVVTAYSGLEALARMDESEPDIVLLDVMMPAWMGSKSAAALKPIPRPACSVVMVTALDQPATAWRGWSRGR